MVTEKVEANEQIRRAQARLGLGDGEKLPFLCECDDVACRTILKLTTAEYDSARIRDGRCIVVPGHPHGGRVVHDGDGYAVVEE